MYRIILGGLYLAFIVLKGDKIEMKIKKLVSIGALGLALTMFSSIGAFAAERPSKEKLQADMIAMFLANKSPISYNVNTNTKIGTIINLSRLKTTIEKYEVDKANYAKLNKALDLLESNKTLLENAKIIVNAFNKDDLDALVAEVRSVAVTLRDIENGGIVKGHDKYELESDIKALVREYNPNYNVLFGMNKNGEIAMSVINNYQVILQLDSGDAYKISDFLNNNAANLVTYAQTFKDLVK